MAELDVTADLRLEITSPAGESTTARVTGRGRQVQVETERPDVVLAAVDRKDAGRVADLLAASGVTVSVVGPRGAIATLGAHTSSRVGQFLTGSTRVSATPLGVIRLGLGLRAVRVVAVAVPVAVVLTAVLRQARRSSGRG